MLPRWAPAVAASSFFFVVLAPFACSASKLAAGPLLPDAGAPDVTEAGVRPTIQVTQNSYDHAGTGANTKETFLNLANVNMATFGKLFTLPVDGDQFAQPLYMGGLKMGDGKTHNVVFAATENDSVYAYDADVASTTPLWHATVGTAAAVPNPWFSGAEWADGNVVCSNYNLRQSGLTATPVIDPASGTLYVLALDVDASQTTAGKCLNVTTCATYACNDLPTITYKLHALDLATGKEKFGGPVIVTKTVDGSGAASKSGKITFDATVSFARTSLLLENGMIYFATASYGDQGSYNGWLFAYNAQTLEQTGVFNTTPNGKKGGIWQSGRGPLADSAGNIYVVTSNGTFDVNSGGDDWGDSALRFSAADTTLQKPADYFSPFLSDFQGTDLLSEMDADLGSAGGTLIPGTSLMLISGKLGIAYLLDTNNLGQWNANHDAVVQETRIAWRSTTTSCATELAEADVYASPVAWVGPNGTHVYVWAVADYLRDLLLDGNGKFKDSGRLCFCNPWVVESLTINVADPDCAEPESQGTFVGGHWSMGAALSVSSNGTTAGTGILWATHTPTQDDASHSVVPGVLEAYDATDVSAPIWTSNDNAARDALGNWAKFSPPTIANGKVYTPTFSNALVVYGILP